MSKIRSYMNFVDGAWTAALAGRSIDRENPANGRLVARWADSSAEDVDHAVAVALRTFENGSWSGLSGGERGVILSAVSRILKNNPKELAQIESEETGKPLRQALDEVRWAGDIWDFSAGQARALHGEVHSNLGDGKMALVLREPAGPIGIITPWNYPLVVLSQKLPFALAAGCTVVIKPSELTSGTTLALAEILVKSGLPRGVVNVVTGYGDPVGQRLAEHPDLRVISFTGSTATGRRIVQASASNMKRVVLELGGKNPTIIFADADLDAAADGTIKGFVYNSGAECCSGSRVFVQRQALPAFLEKLRAKLATVVTGDPADPATRMGSVISKAHFEKICRYIELGKAEGKIAIGGKIRTDLPGYFIEPTVFTDISPSSPVAREEIFGPVVTLFAFDTMEDAIRMGNDTEYGLASSIWTRDFETAMVMTRKIRSGIVWMNTFLDVPSEVPIGGTKASGYGRENGRQAIEEFTVAKTAVLQNPSSYAHYLG